MELRVGQIGIEAASSLQNSFLGKAHFRHQPVGVSAFFFQDGTGWLVTRWQVAELFPATLLQVCVQFSSHI